MSFAKPSSYFAVPLVAALALAGCGSHVPLTPALPATTASAATLPPKSAAAAPAANPWAGVQEQVGRYPSSGEDFLRNGPIARRLQGLLGPVNYPVFLQNMGTSGPLRQEGPLIYITGNRPHEGGAESAAMVLDPARDVMRAWLQTGDEEWDVQDAGPAVPLPAEVRQFIQNARGV
ncbi:hypothetical protein [Acidovorax sp. Leaf160]|uniref:hypothetical protein n=1 Tax=Acidovorax sp. Leaf160 TaxID=1736280 RepID=UPI0006F9C0FA|nr:hypothetical protein [Acidovorax sp. Leaf160]KQR45962.1 hypothetical protein ASF94_09450 [Acidovorax sp. Leaf160]